MHKVKVGVIGAGSISDLHLLAYAHHPDVEIVAVCDLVETRAKEKAEIYNIQHVFTDYKALLSLPEIDAVSICTWNDSHAKIAIAALSYGKHVLVEKPMCKTVKEAEEIKRAVASAEKTLQVGFVRRFATNTTVLKRFIDNDDLGAIYYAKASALRVLGNPGGWFSDREKSGGGPLIDIGVHMLDICWYLMGKPKVKSVTGQTFNKLGNRKNIEFKSFYQAADYDKAHNNVEDLACALIKFEHGQTLMLDASFTLHAQDEKTDIVLYGEKGGATLEPALVISSEQHDVMTNITPNIDHLSFDFSDSFQREINHFIASVRHETDTIAPVLDGLEITKILAAIYESSAENKEITFD